MCSLLVVTKKWWPSSVIVVYICILYTEERRYSSYIYVSVVFFVVAFNIFFWLSLALLLLWTSFNISTQARLNHFVHTFSFQILICMCVATSFQCQFFDCVVATRRFFFSFFSLLSTSFSIQYSRSEFASRNSLFFVKKNIYNVPKRTCRIESHVCVWFSAAVHTH